MSVMPTAFFLNTNGSQFSNLLDGGSEIPLSPDINIVRAYGTLTPSINPCTRK
jgi:hypothetical protein